MPYSLRNRRLLMDKTVRELLPLSSPTGITGLVLWLDGSDISTLFQDTAATSPVTANGQSVARINDKSGAGNNVTQATGATQPIYQTGIQNGLSAIQFDGNRHMDTVTTFANFPVTIIGVARTNTTITVARGLLTIRHSTNFGLRVSLTTTDFVQGTVGPTDVNRSAAIAIGTNETFLFGVKADASSLYVIKNGVISPSSAHAASTVSNIARLGGINVNTTGTRMQGHIMEVCMYSSALSNDDIARLCSYFDNKWNIY